MSVALIQSLCDLLVFMCRICPVLSCYCAFLDLIHHKSSIGEHVFSLLHLFCYITTIFVDTQLILTGPDNITILKDIDNIAILWCKILW